MTDPKQNKKEHKDSAQVVYEYLRELAKAPFYGKVEVAFENGHIIYVRKTETLKIKG